MIEPATTGLQGEWLIHYTTAATEIVFYSAMLVMQMGTELERDASKY